MSDTVDLLLYLASDVTDGYGPRPIPSSIDEKVSELIASFEAMDAIGRRAALSIMEQRHGFVLIAFAERMSSLSVRTKRQDLIVSALSALAIAAKLVYFKEAMPVMSLLYRSVQKLGQNPRCILSNLGSLADQQFSEFVNNFLKRSEEDRSIEAMGYEETSDADGFRYSRTW
jgi:hypothetical protein